MMNHKDQFSMIPIDWCLKLCWATNESRTQTRSLHLQLNTIKSYQADCIQVAELGESQHSESQRDLGGKC